MTAADTFGAFVEWDIRNWSLAPEFWERHTTLDLARCNALEIGSRHGGLSLWLAEHGAHVTCSDVDGPSPQARRAHLTAGATPRISYERIDATAVPYEEAFDVVIFKSVLGAIDGADRRAAQAKAIGEMYKALRPGGELFFAENLVASPAHQYLRRRFVRWGQSWRYVTVAEMLAHLSPFRDVAYRTVGLLGALGRSPRQRALLGALDRALVDRLVPESWRYVMIGVARK